MIDHTLYDAFGQRQVSTMFTQLNQYHVVIEVAIAEKSQHTPPELFRTSTVFPTAGAKFPSPPSPVTVRRHRWPSIIKDNFRCTCRSISLRAVRSATRWRNQHRRTEIGLPASIQGAFQGRGPAFQNSLANEPMLILAALITVYIVLGVLYESYIHPVTILSTLPSAGVGAFLASALPDGFRRHRADRTDPADWNCEKNAIMMIDFALAAQRSDGTPLHAIYQACLLRFRPILMTTMAAMLGGFPLAFGAGTGSELRKPLGITIIGGLMVSQILTLYTTPVIYLAFDRLARRVTRRGASGVLVSPQIAEGI